jgi:S-adenosylmethionine decarboxylase
VVQASSHGSSPHQDLCPETTPVPHVGQHLLIDLWGAKNLDDLDVVQTTILESTHACGANLIVLKLHQFEVGNGITGVAILSQSHMAIHTWPEIGYAAIDLFVCGTNDPHMIIPILHAYFTPTQIKIAEQKRGVLSL